MLAVISFITGLAPMLAQVTNKIADLQMLKVKAQSDTEIKDIDRRIEEAHDRRMILQAEAASRLGVLLNGGMRALMALPVVLFLNKWLVWDKVIGSFAGCSGKTPLSPMDKCYSFVTDPLDSNTWLIILGVCGFYFAYDFGSKVFKK